jgi:hypothetical protein
VEERETLHTDSGKHINTVNMDGSMYIFQKVKNRTTISFNNLTIGDIPKGNEIIIPKEYLYSHI